MTATNSAIQRAPFLKAFSEVIAAKDTLDVASLVDGAGATSTHTVLGAALGDFAIISLAVDLVGITVTGQVSAADTVKIRVQNESTATVDLASTTVRILVLKPGPIFDGL